MVTDADIQKVYGNFGSAKTLIVLNTLSQSSSKWRVVARWILNEGCEDEIILVFRLLRPEKDEV